MNHPVLSALLPVVLLIAVGFFAGKRNWISAGSVKDLSNLTFLLLIPALLFRTMGGVHVEQLDLRPIGAYFSAALCLLALLVLWLGLNPRGVVLALAGLLVLLAGAVALLPVFARDIRALIADYDEMREALERIQSAAGELEQRISELEEGVSTEADVRQRFGALCIGFDAPT